MRRCPRFAFWAAHLRWAAHRRVAHYRSDLIAARSTAAKAGTEAAVEQHGPDLLLVAGLVLVGLVDPTDALFVALVVADQRRCR